jgi:hypothetical protein
MNRREFLRSLGIISAAAVAPKFIFDVGANLYKRKPICLEDFEFEIKPLLITMRYDEGKVYVVEVPKGGFNGIYRGNPPTLF